MVTQEPLLFAEYNLKPAFTPDTFTVWPGMRVAGVDEVGRGPLVGDVVTAAVILDPKSPIQGLADSKSISEKKRDDLFEKIKASVLAWAIGRASSEEIDKLNILKATMLAMQRAVSALPHAPHVKPDAVLVDGNRCPDFGLPAQAVVKGDGWIPAISAASILAKVVRDRDMYLLDQQFPQYGFAKHKGYPTRQHLEALKKFGPLKEHRKSFAPVTALLSQGSLF